MAVVVVTVDRCWKLWARCWQTTWTGSLDEIGEAAYEHVMTDRCMDCIEWGFGPGQFHQQRVFAGARIRDRHVTALEVRH